MLQITLAKFRTIGLALLMVAMLGVGTMTPVNQATAQEATSEQRAAMLEQINMLMQLIAQLTKQLQARTQQAPVDKKQSIYQQSPDELVIEQSASQFVSNDTDKLVHIFLPSNEGVRYLNKAIIGAVSNQDTTKPWVTFDRIEIKAGGVSEVVIDASDRDTWERTTWGESKGYVLNLYDKNETGYGAKIPFWVNDVEVIVTTSRVAAQNGTEAWTWFVPEGGIQTWSQRSGDVSNGGIGLTSLVREKGVPEYTTEEMVDFLNGVHPSSPAGKELQSNVDSLLEQVANNHRDSEQALSNWGQVLVNSSSDIPDDTFRVYWVNSETLENRLSSELTDEIAFEYLTYGQDKHRGEHPGGYWVGSFELESNQAVNFRMSDPGWDTASLYINGSKQPIEENKQFTFTAPTADKYLIEVLYETNWHSGEFSVKHNLTD